MSNSINIMLSRFLNSKTIVNGLPSAAYTDEEFWKKECDTVFKENWVFTGFVHEFKKIGAPKISEINNPNLIIILH